MEVHPQKTNVEPKNEGLQDDSPFKRLFFRFNVDFRVFFSALTPFNLA